MLALAFDAGSTYAGYALLRARFVERGAPQIECLRHEHASMECDHGVLERMAIQRVHAFADQALRLREPGERMLAIVEGVEGIVYRGNEPTPLFDTADQAGLIRGALGSWCILRSVDRFDVDGTTAAKVRKFIFENQVDGRIGDTEVALVVRHYVRSGLPPIAFPVKDHDKAMHAHDAAAAGLLVIAKACGWKAISIPTALHVEIERQRFKERTAEAEKKLRKKLGIPAPKKARVETRGTRRRRKEGAIAAAARRLP